MSENEKKVTMTAEGLKALQDRLEYLKGPGRAKVIEQIAIARGFGDLSENAEYDEARNEQSKLEGEIVELEATLRNAVVISDEAITTDRVNLGTTVHLKNLDENEEETYCIVGSREANPLKGIISSESPIGSALMGKRAGDEVIAVTPAGDIHYLIQSIDRT